MTDISIRKLTPTATGVAAFLIIITGLKLAASVVNPLLMAFFISIIFAQPEEAYKYSYNALVNLFWQPVEGARLGIEFANGQRFDKGPFRGHANRLSALIYYDF